MLHLAREAIRTSGPTLTRPPIRHSSHVAPCEHGRALRYPSLRLSAAFHKTLSSTTAAGNGDVVCIEALSVATSLDLVELEERVLMTSILQPRARSLIRTPCSSVDARHALVGRIQSHCGLLHDCALNSRSWGSRGPRGASSPELRTCRNPSRGSLDGRPTGNAAARRRPRLVRDRNSKPSF